MRGPGSNADHEVRDADEAREGAVAAIVEQEADFWAPLVDGHAGHEGHGADTRSKQRQRDDWQLSVLHVQTSESGHAAVRRHIDTGWPGIDRHRQ